MAEVDKVVLERGRRFKEALENPDSDLSWLLSKLAEAEERSLNWLREYRYGPGQPVPLDWFQGHYKGTCLFREEVQAAIDAGAEEARKFAENQATGPQEKTAPEGENRR